jgi:hypothetical protein
LKGEDRRSKGEDIRSRGDDRKSKGGDQRWRRGKVRLKGRAKRKLNLGLRERVRAKLVFKGALAGGKTKLVWVGIR